MGVDQLLAGLDGLLEVAFVEQLAVGGRLDSPEVLADRWFDSRAIISPRREVLNEEVDERLNWCLSNFIDPLRQSILQWRQRWTRILGGCKFAAAAREMATTTPLVRNIGIPLHVAVAISGHYASLWYTRAPNR
jgi:hypothetical protein